MPSERPVHDWISKHFSWNLTFAFHSPDRCGERSLPFLRQPLKQITLNAAIQRRGSSLQRAVAWICPERPAVGPESRVPATQEPLAILEIHDRQHAVVDRLDEWRRFGGDRGVTSETAASNPLAFFFCFTRYALHMPPSIAHAGPAINRLTVMLSHVLAPTTFPNPVFQTFPGLFK
jgi:hypothetical protein